MGIKGISEQRRLPRLGHLRLGVKIRKGQVEYPKEVDHFILDPKTPDPSWNEQLKNQFHTLYGPEPKAIKIMFPPAHPDLFFAQWYKRYGASTLVKCKGDGEIATTTEEFAQGLEKIGEDERGFWQVKCLGEECPYQKGGNKFSKKRQCSRMAALQVILPELKGMGIWQINTGSYHSIVNINSAIDWLKGFCGRYAMVPITLMRVLTDIQYEGKRSKHWILQVDTMDVSIGDIQKFVATRPVETALIPGPDESKDALFYDQQGNKTENHQERALPGSVEPPLKEIPKEPIQKPKTETKTDAKPNVTLCSLGDTSRFKKDSFKADNLGQAIKKLYADLGQEKFMYVLGSCGYEKVDQIPSIEQLSVFVNTLLAEKNNK